SKRTKKMASWSINEQSETCDVIDEPEDHANAKPMLYDSEGNRGVVHIFNYYEFKDKERVDQFEGGEEDAKALLKVFKSMEYNVKVWDNLSKAKTDKAFQDIQRTKGLSKEFVLIFYILSHGKDQNTYLSSDFRKNNLMEKIIMFRKDKCTAMRYKPVIWFGDFCRGSKLQRGVGPVSAKFDTKAEPGMYKYGKEEGLTNTAYIMSSGPGFLSMYDREQAFTPIICQMLKEKTYQMNNLDDKWFMELNARLRKNKLTNSARQVFDPFPGQLFFEEGFSFRFDRHTIGKRAIPPRKFPARKSKERA
ncbi:unnamed protein product, partial [Meganyctiphanes norvegica]